MAEPTNEKQLVAAIRKAVHRAYPSAWQIKTVGGPYQVVGLPDLLFCIEGLHVGCEAKFPRPGESHEAMLLRVTPGQRHQIALINDAGGIAGAVSSVAEALDLIERGFIKHNALYHQSEQPHERRN